MSVYEIHLADDICLHFIVVLDNAQTVDPYISSVYLLSEVDLIRGTHDYWYS
jgi:hypothetical protein